MSSLVVLLMVLALVLAALGVWSLWTGSPDQRQGAGLDTVLRVLGPLAKLSAPEVKWEGSPLRQKFMQAGIRSAQAPLIFFGAKTLLPILVAGAAYLALRAAGVAQDRNTFLFVLLVLALLACYLPNLLVHRWAASRQREIFDNFPDAADLVLVCVEAGLGLDAALIRVAEEIRLKSRVLAQEIHWTNLEIRAGMARDQALRHLGQRSGLAEVATFATLLSQADKFGTGVGEALRVFSDDLRYKRQMRAEELAAKVSTKMLFPLVLCIFPAISLVVLGPAVIRIMRSLLPMMSGQPMP
jgi:tight adherence protein C